MRAKTKNVFQKPLFKNRFQKTLSENGFQKHFFRNGFRMDSPALRAAKKSATESAATKLIERLGNVYPPSTQSRIDETDKLWIRHAMQDLATELENLQILVER